MYEYIPKAKKVKVVSSALFFLALALFAASGLPIFAYRGVLQFVSVLLFAVSLLLFCKKQYIYRIEETDLVIEELSRSARVTVCRLEKAKLQKMEKWQKGLKPQKGAKIYNYCVDIAPENSYLLTFTDGAYAPYCKDICVRFQPDEKMVRLLGGLQNEL